jgi:hypothetical protein
MTPRGAYRIKHIKIYIGEFVFIKMLTDPLEVIISSIEVA